jgi:hypothetical protein
MKKWYDFFTEEPPSGHLDRVMMAAKDDFQKLSVQQKRSFFSQVILGWQGMALGGGLAAIIGIWFFMKSKKSDGQDLDFLAFQENFGSEIEDIDLISDYSADFELLENLDFLEDMEDS